MGRLLFTNVNVLDCTGAEPFPGQVLIEGEHIKEVWRAQQAPRVDDAQGIDGRGGTLMPGLIEPHAHLTFTNCVQSVEMGFIPVEEHLLIALENARTMLEAGFTSCFSAASAKKRLDIVLRNAIEAGKFPGPRLLAASPEMTVTGGLGDVRLPHLYRENFAVILDGPDQFRLFAREMCREGVDTLKINVSGTPARRRPPLIAQSCRSRDRGRLRRGARLRQARRRARPQCRSSEALSALRSERALPRHAGGRGGPGHAHGRARAGVHRAHPGQPLRHAV
jgi:imidazolonepropionase-like amidohydrolase